MSRHSRRAALPRPGGVSQPDTLARPAWTPFERVHAVPAPRGDIEAAIARFPHMDPAEIRAEFARRLEDELWRNSRYQVARAPVEAGRFPAMIHLSIKRLDREPLHDWRDLQRIKNELVGAEHEAVELFPAESRLVDTANQYHLWVLAEAGVTFPFGFADRLVDDRPTGKARQRRFEP